MKFTDLTRRALKDWEEQSRKRMEKMDKILTDFNELQDDMDENFSYMNTRALRLVSMQMDLFALQSYSETLKKRLEEKKKEIDVPVKPLERDLFHPKSWITM